MISLLLHCANAVLLSLLAHQLMQTSLPSAASQPPLASHYAAAAVALSYSLHPLRDQAVNWASSRPYPLGGVFLPAFGVGPCQS